MAYEKLSDIPSLVKARFGDDPPWQAATLRPDDIRAGHTLAIAVNGVAFMAHVSAMSDPHKAVLAPFEALMKIRDDGEKRGREAEKVSQLASIEAKVDEHTGLIQRLSDQLHAVLNKGKIDG